MNAIYARQSLDKKDSISIETQIELCKQEVENAPCKLYIDKGFSGKNINRPEFTRMMDDVRAGVIDCVLVYKLDRLSRSLLDFAEMINVFNQRGVSFISTKEKFDTGTPIGNAMLNIVMVFAQLERETIQIRVKDNYHARSKRGSYDARPPYGFKKAKIQLDGKKVITLEPEEETAKIVQDLFERYTYSGISLGELARDLNKHGISSPAGADWDSSKLTRLFGNPIYVRATPDVYAYYNARGANVTNPVDDYNGTNGCVTYGAWDRMQRKFTQWEALSISVGLHEGIVDAETFLKCQSRLCANKQLQRGMKGKHSWLTGIIKCGCCKHALKVNSYKDKFTFVCSGKTNYGTCEDSPQFSVKEIEDEVSGQILAHVAMRSDLTAKIRQEEDATEKKYRMQTVKIEEQIANLLDAIATSNATTMAYINNRISELDKQKNEITLQYQEYTAGKTTEKQKRQFKDILVSWHAMDIDQKREVAQMLIEKVYVYSSGTIEIHWKYNFQD